MKGTDHLEDRHGWEDNIRVETGCEGMDCIHLVQDRDQWQYLVDAVINIQVP
jgi:hypothetical protein